MIEIMRLVVHRRVFDRVCVLRRLRPLFFLPVLLFAVRVIGECDGYPVSDHRHDLCAAAWLRFPRLRIGVFSGLHPEKGEVVLGLGFEEQRLRRLEFCIMCQ